MVTYLTHLKLYITHFGSFSTIPLSLVNSWWENMLPMTNVDCRCPAVTMKGFIPLMIMRVAFYPWIVKIWKRRASSNDQHSALFCQWYFIMFYIQLTCYSTYPPLWNENCKGSVDCRPLREVFNLLKSLLILFLPFREVARWFIRYAWIWRQFGIVMACHAVCIIG